MLSSPDSALAQINKRLSTRLIVLSAILLGELLAVSLNFDAYLPKLFNGSPGLGFLAYAGQFAKFAVVVIAALILAVWTRLPTHFKALAEVSGDYRAYYLLLLQLLVFALFYWCTAAIFGGSGESAISVGLVLAWFVALISVGVLWLLSVAPWRYWQNFIRQENKALAFSLVVGMLAWWLAQSSQELWGPLSELTFHTSAVLLNIIYPEVIIEPESKNLGTASFLVNIAPACSGYEGIGLVTIFTAFYLSIFRKEFRFPQALLLFPLGIIAIWLFNALRIVVLIAIGSSLSEQVALGGFHSQAGWISFIVVIFGLLMIAHKLSFFSSQPVVAKPSSPLNLPMALLVPFVTLLASTILTAAFTSDFDWLYPLRVVATGIALACCWTLYSINRIKLKLEPVIAGVLVFILWILLIPNDLEQNETFSENLFGVSAGISSVWLLFRFLGAVVTVPLAEELVFRGYLLSRLAKHKVLLEGVLPLSWVALAGSSILFGLLHSAWIAGTLAGFIYGVVRYRSGSIMDAVVAHGVTNLLLSLLVLTTANWSLW